MTRFLEHVAILILASDLYGTLLHDPRRTDTINENNMQSSDQQTAVQWKKSNGYTDKESMGLKGYSLEMNRKRSLRSEIIALLENELNKAYSKKRKTSENSGLTPGLPWKRSEKATVSKLIPALPWKRSEQASVGKLIPALPWKRSDKASVSKMIPALPWKRSGKYSADEIIPALPWKRSEVSSAGEKLVPGLLWKRTAEGPGSPLEQAYGGRRLPWEQADVEPALPWKRNEKDRSRKTLRDGLYKRLVNDINELFHSEEKLRTRRGLTTGEEGMTFLLRRVKFNTVPNLAGVHTAPLAVIP